MVQVTRRHEPFGKPTIRESRSIRNMEACYVTLKVEQGSTRRKIVMEMWTIETQRLICSSDPIDVIVSADPLAHGLQLLSVPGNQFVVVQKDSYCLQWTLFSIVYHAPSSRTALLPSTPQISIEQISQYEKPDSQWSHLKVIDHHRLLSIEETTSRCTARIYQTNDGLEVSSVTSITRNNNSLVKEYSTPWCSSNDIDRIIKYANVDVSDSVSMSTADVFELKPNSICSYFEEVGLIVNYKHDRLSVWRKHGRKLTRMLMRVVGEFYPAMFFNSIVGDYCLMESYGKCRIASIRDTKTKDVSDLSRHTCLVAPTMEQFRIVCRPVLATVLKGCRDLSDLVISYLVDVHSVNANVPF